MPATFFTVVLTAHVLSPTIKINHSEDACRKEFVLQEASSKRLQFLHIAAENGNESIVVECLLSHLREARKKNGVAEVCMPAILDHHRRTVLHCACLGLQLDVVRLLLGYTVPVRFFGWGTRVDTLTSILASCEECGGTLTGRRVCSNGDPVYDVRLPRSLTFTPQDFSSGGSMTDHFGNTALICASSTALDYDFSNNKNNALATTSAPQNAVSNGVYVHLSVKASILKLLMDVGDSPIHKNPLTGWTPLHWAAYYGDVEGCCVLLGAIDPGFFSPPESTHCTAFVHDILDSKVSAVTKGLYTAHENVIGKWLRLRVDLIEDDLKDVEEWKEGVILDCRCASTSASKVMEHLVGFPRGN
jgi:ankyrin repeat protein